MKLLRLAMVVWALVTLDQQSNMGVEPRSSLPSPCILPVETKAAIDEINALDLTGVPEAEGIRRRCDAWRQLLQRDPKDVFIHRAFQDFIKDEGTDELEATRRWYEELVRNHPDDSLYMYLCGRMASQEAPQVACDWFERAVGKDPSSPWPHIGLLYVYSRNNPLHNPEKFNKHAAALFDICPDSEEFSAYADQITDPTLGSRVVARMRAALQALPVEHALVLYPRLWSVEFRVTPPDRHGQARSHVRQDIDWIRAARIEKNPRWWTALYSGYEMIGDRSGQEWVIAEVLKHIPDSEEAKGLVISGWRKFNLQDPRQTEAEREESFRRYLTVTEEWVKRWPDDPIVNLERYLALTKSPDAAPAEVDRAVDVVLAGTTGGKPVISGSSLLNIAAYYAECGRRLDIVPKLVDRATELVEARRARMKWTGDDEEMKRVYRQEDVALRWRSWDILSNCALKRSDAGTLQRLLREMRDDLVKNAPLDTADVDEQEGYRARLHSFWVLHAKTAEMGGGWIEAFLFYDRALSQDPDDTQSLENARALWTRLGGTPEGWQTALFSARARARETTGVPARWRVANIALPDRSFVDLTGKQWCIGDLRGKVLLINVWATWCGPCRLELPRFQELYDALKAQPGVAVFTLNVDYNPGPVAPYIESGRFTFPVLPAFDYVDSLLRSLNQDLVVPRTWIVNAQGTVVREMIGFDLDDREWKTRALELIAELRKGPTGPKGDLSPRAD